MFQNRLKKKDDEFSLSLSNFLFHVDADIIISTSLIGLALTFISLSFIVSSSLFSFVTNGVRDFYAIDSLGLLNYMRIIMVSIEYILSMCVPMIIYVVATYFIKFTTRPKLECCFTCMKVKPLVFVALVLAGFSLAILANLPSQIILTGVGVSAKESAVNGFLSEFTKTNLTLDIIFSFFRRAFLPAFLEEIVFRGLLLGVLRRFGDGYAILFSSLLFSLFHGNLSQAIFTFIVGLILGYIMVRSNNIIIPMIVHFMNNAFSVLIGILSHAIADFSAINPYIFLSIYLLGAISLFYLIFLQKGSYIKLPKRFSIPFSRRAFMTLISPGFAIAIIFSLAEIIFM